MVRYMVKDRCLLLAMIGNNLVLTLYVLNFDDKVLISVTCYCLPYVIEDYTAVLN